MLIIFLYIIAITIPFDIRDLDIDNNNIKTIPQIIGAKNSYFITHLLLVILSIYAFAFIKYGLFFLMILTIAVLIPSIKRKNEFYYLFIIDGLLIVFPIFV